MTDWQIELKNYRCFADEAPARFTVRDGFTAFVGPNNAGKSTALRFFYEFRNLFALLSSRDIPSNVNNETRLLWNGVTTGWSNLQPPIRDQSEVFYNGNDRPMRMKLSLLEPQEGEVETLDLAVTRPPVQGITVTMSIQIHQDGQATGYVQDPQAALGALQDGRWMNAQSTSVMLDADRIIRVAAQVANGIYIGAFRNAIHAGSASYYDLHIGQAFIEQWRQFKTGPNRLQNVAAIRLTEEIKRIFGFDDLEINASAGGDTLQLFVDGQTYVLAELGAGLAQFVVLLAFVATRRPSLVLIDEPELNLHPLLQQDLLLSLRNYATGPVLFGTHNLGLARAVAHDIYVCHKAGRASQLSHLSGYPRLAELLGELSFAGYQELGFSKLLLVEGPHDVTAIRELLRLYQKDHEVVLMPLGGASMINRDVEEQLHEIKRITSDIMAIVDSERTGANASLPDNVAGFEQACHEASVECLVLDRRALEHYLPEHSIRAVKGPSYRALSPYEDFKSLDPRWGKAENAAIARRMTVDDLAGTDLGDFLENL